MGGGEGIPGEHEAVAPVQELERRAEQAAGLGLSPRDTGPPASLERACAVDARSKRLRNQGVWRRCIWRRCIHLPAGSFMEATDGRQRVAIPEGSQFAHKFEGEFRKRCEQLRERLRALRIPILPICTHDPVPEQVLAALGGHRGA